MKSLVTLGHGSTTLHIVDLDQSDDCTGGALLRLASPGLTAEKWITGQPGSGLDGLVAFIGGLAEQWRGWTGSRSWQSLEGDLELDARHDGHVRMDVRLATAQWTVDAAVSIDPGEELAVAALEFARLIT